MVHRDSIVGATHFVRLNSASRPLTIVTEPSPAPTRKSPVLSLHSAVTPLLKFSLGPFTCKHAGCEFVSLNFGYSFKFQRAQFRLLSVVLLWLLSLSIHNYFKNSLYFYLRINPSIATSLFSHDFSVASQQLPLHPN